MLLVLYLSAAGRAITELTPSTLSVMGKGLLIDMHTCSAIVINFLITKTPDFTSYHCCMITLRERRILLQSLGIFWQLNSSILSAVNVLPPSQICVLAVTQLLMVVVCLLISKCDVMETSYTNGALLPGYICEYTVTSNVEGERNGTSAKVSIIIRHAL